MRRTERIGLWAAVALIAVSAWTLPAQQQRRATRIAVLAAGTPIDVRLLSELNTENAKTGDRFEATLAEPLMVNGRTAFAKNTTVRGRVVEAVSSGRLKRPASLTLELDSVGGQTLRSEPVKVDGESHAGRNAALIGGGAAAGAIIGAVTGGGKGAAIGAAAGAGAGTATAYLTGKKELVLPVEMPIRFVAAGPGAAPASSVARGDADDRPTEETSSLAEQRRVRTAQSGAGRTGAVAADYLFSDSDRRVITDYLRTNRSNLPPGLAKRDRLPPGLERQLRRNGRLPPGLQKRVQPFPTDLSRRLPPLPAGADRVFLGHRAIILDASRRILDIFLVN